MTVRVFRRACSTAGDHAVIPSDVVCHGAGPLSAQVDSRQSAARLRATLAPGLRPAPYCNIGPRPPWPLPCTLDTYR